MLSFPLLFMHNMSHETLNLCFCLLIFILKGPEVGFYVLLLLLIIIIIIILHVPTIDLYIKVLKVLRVLHLKLKSHHEMKESSQG